MLVVFLEIRLYFENVLDQWVYIITHLFNLCIKCSQLFIFIFKLNNLVLLVQSCTDSLFSDHFTDDLFSSSWLNAKEACHLREANIHVDLWDNFNIVLNKSLWKNGIAIWVLYILVSLQAVLKFFDMFMLDHFLFEELLQKIKELIRLDSFILI